jgi:hypothetical protein
LKNLQIFLFPFSPEDSLVLSFFPFLSFLFDFFDSPLFSLSLFSDILSFFFSETFLESFLSILICKKSQFSPFTHPLFELKNLQIFSFSSVAVETKYILINKGNK